MLSSRAAFLVVSVVLSLGACRERVAVSTAGGPLDAGVPPGSMPQNPQLVTEVRPHFVKVLREQGFPLSCEDEPTEGEPRAQRSWERASTENRADGVEVIRFFREATVPGERGEGCCPPCLDPCSESGCGYCAPADQCVEYAIRHQLLATFVRDEVGRLTQTVERYTSPPERVTRVPYVPPVEPPPDVRPPPLPGPMPFVPPGSVLMPLVPPPPPPPAGQGTLSLQAPEVESADVDREKLATYVRSRKGALLQCYVKALKRAPTLKGKVVVRFTITPAGRASDLDIEENTVGAEEVASCIKAMIRGWVFPFKPKSPVPVAYPFVFSPGS